MSRGLHATAKALAESFSAARDVSLPKDIYAAIGYSPWPLQKTLDAEDRRFNVRVLHRRFGKTVREVAKLIERAIECPFDAGRYAYLAPTYSMAEDIAWAYIAQYHENLCKKLGLDHTKLRHAGKLFVWLPTRRGDWARIRLYGVDNPKQRMRGLYLDGCVFDEYAWIPPSVWTDQVRPMLMDESRRGVDEHGRLNQWCDFIFTPLGRNHAYTLYRKADQWFRGEAVREEDEEGEEVDTRSDEWAACRYRASETGILSKKELRAALNDMGRSKYDQEMECSFDAAVEGSIYADEIEGLRAVGNVRRVPVNPLIPVNTAWDLGWDDATAIWFFQQRNEEIYVVDYLETSGASLERLASMLAERDYRYGYHLLPWDVEVSELGTGKSRSSVLRELGVRVSVVTRHSPWDGIAAVQALLPRCHFDETKCAEGLDRLALYRREYDERRGVMREKPLHDWTSHACFTGDTLVLTRHGTRQIMDLPETGEVLTPCGWKQYVYPRMTKRSARLVEVVFADGHTVRCTPDHLFLTASGWKSAENLTAGTLIRSSLTHSRSTSTAASTAFGRAIATTRAAVEGCTAMFGAALLGASLKAATFTTRTTTQATTASPTLSAWALGNTCLTRGRRRGSAIGSSISARKQETGPLSGTARRLGAFGTDAMPNEPRAGRNGEENRKPVSSAVKSIWRWFVKTAILRSSARSDAKPLTIAHVKPLVEREDVYDLTVPDGHCFSLANGAIVHNCDAFRSLAMGMRQPRRPGAPDPMRTTHAVL